MNVPAIAAPLAAFGLLAACHSQSSVEQVNAEQAAELNAIAANMSNSAGREPDANQADLGEIYRAGAGNPPRRY
jgi:uncharacterized lipoprotein YajG